MKQIPQTVDEQELLSVYRAARSNKFKGALTLHFGGDGYEPGIECDILKVKGRDVIELLTKDREIKR